LNVTVVPKDVWDHARAERSHLPAKPAPNTFYGSWVWQSRIGKLLPGGEDKWWWLSADEDWTGPAHEVVEAVRTYVLPEMRRRLSAA
jgi:hypothetical protein